MRSATELDGRPGERETGPRVTLQEPDVVELGNGSVMMFARTASGSQFVSFSSDLGETWSRPVPSALLSPVSPASMERVPGTRDLAAVWNDHRGVDPAIQGNRTPFSIAIFHDDGTTWSPSRTLDDLATDWYCYTALHWIDPDTLLLAGTAPSKTAWPGSD